MELYKLHYFDSLFDLNVKGDSAEVLATILKFIHGSYIAREQRAVCKPNEDELDSQCGEECFVHSQCYLKLRVNFMCRCG